MDTAYRIRAATEADIESVVTLERAIQDAPHWAVADYRAALYHADPAPAAGGTRRCFFAAVASEKVVGFAVGQATVLEADVLAELESIAVAEAMRRAGIGRALCEAVIAWAREQGAAEIGLEVRGGSHGALALYTAFGFARVGTRARYYRDPVDDAILMRLALR